MNNKLTILLLFVGFTFCNPVAYGQSECDKPESSSNLMAMGRAGSAAALQEALKKSPNDPSIHFQLGKFYENRYLDSDFLTQYHSAKGNAELARNAYSKCLENFNEEAANSNQEVFQAPYATIQSELESNLTRLESFLTEMPKIYSLFTAGLHHYDVADKGYTAINNRYETLKELYLLYDEPLSEEMRLIKMHYDSAILVFNQYEEAISRYPIQNYRQRLVIREIENYRLDGLEVAVNFLDELVEIWHYSAWVDEVVEKVDTDIQSMRDQLVAMEIELQSGLDKIEKENFDLIAR